MIQPNDMGDAPSGPGLSAPEGAPIPIAEIRTAPEQWEVERAEAFVPTGMVLADRVALEMALHTAMMSAFKARLPERDYFGEIAQALADILFGNQRPPGWYCSKCGINRLDSPCPKGHHAALTGDCPMVANAANLPAKE